MKTAIYRPYPDSGIQAFLWTIFLLLGMLNQGCRGKKEGGAKTIVCLVDMSATPDHADRMEQFLGVVQKNILQRLPYGASVTVLPLDRASSTASQELVTGKVAGNLISYQISPLRPMRRKWPRRAVSIILIVSVIALALHLKRQ